jgi:hypothetical protein
MAYVLVTDHEMRGFFERRGREGFAEGAKGVPKVSGFCGHRADTVCNGERPGVALHARLGVHHPPSYWSTRNRSADEHLSVCDQSSVLPVVSGKNYSAITGSALLCVQAIERMRIDRFLVLQYEGNSHTLYRPKRNQRLYKPVATHHLSHGATSAGKPCQTDAQP